MWTAWRQLLMCRVFTSLLRAVKTFPHMMLLAITKLARNTSLPRNVVITLIVTQHRMVVALGTRPIGILNSPILSCLSN